MNKLFKYLIIFIFICSEFTFSQNIPENINSHIYEFLERLDEKHIINIETESKPYSINEIKRNLIAIQDKKYLLTKVERQLLDYYTNYYMKKEDFYLIGYRYADKNFDLRVEPVINYSGRVNNGKFSYGRASGARLFLSYQNNFSIYSHLQDRGDYKNFSEMNRKISSLRGYNFQVEKNGFEYSDIISGVVIGDEKLNLQLAKDYNKWGNGKFGQIILSDKVNSFPHLKFEFKPVDWFRFRYIFGTLNSRVIDSNNYYYSNPMSQLNEKRFDYINKYLVANLLTISPFRYIDFSLGNSHIYSGNLRLEMFLPLAFYKYLDRDIGKDVNKDGNGQMFFDISIRYPKNFKFYGTWFIDMISIRKTLKRNYVENWFAYTVGAKAIDPLIKDLSINVEYTKISPWVYDHKDITTNYKHLNYTLGHWLGQNGDLIDIYLKYFLHYNLRIDLLFEYMRKGAELDIYYAYDGRNEISVYFLYPPVRRDLKIKLGVEYEPIYSLIIRFSYGHTFIQDDDLIRTSKNLIGKKDIFTISIDYGFPY